MTTPIRSIRDLIVDIATFRFEGDYHERLNRLGDEVRSHPEGAAAIPSVFHLFEKEADRDPELFASLKHAVERFSGKGYEQCLIASARRRPTLLTIDLVNRVVNGDEPDKPVFLSLLGQIATRVDLPADVRVEAARLFEYQTQGSTHSTHSPLFPEVAEERRKALQEALGQHIVRERNRMAVMVRQYIEGDRKFYTPIYDRMLDRLRRLDPDTRADVASAALLMADEIVTGVLAVFDGGDTKEFEGKVVNYAIVAQLRGPGSDDVGEQVDVNRGNPIIAIWNAYRKWLSRYAPSEVRPSASPRPFQDGRQASGQAPPEV